MYRGVIIVAALVTAGGAGLPAAAQLTEAEELGLLAPDDLKDPRRPSTTDYAPKPVPRSVGQPNVAGTPPPPSAPGATAGPGYQLNPGDVLQISVWNEESLNQQVLVRPDGGFSYPLVGDVQASGRTTDEIREELVSRLERYIPEPEVAVSLLQVAGNKVYVLGKVQRPGEFVMTHRLDVMQALSLAGGTTTFASVNNIKILRRQNGGQVAIPFRYSEVLSGADLAQNIELQNGDVVVVP